MSYQYKLIVYNKHAYKEFEIPPDMDRVKVGTTTVCDFRLNPDYFFGDIEVLLKNQDGWSMQCSDNLFISCGDIRKLFFTKLNLGDQFSICYVESGEMAFSVRFMIDFEAEIPNYCWKIDLNQKSQIMISDRAGAEIELESEFGRDTLVFLRVRGNGVDLEEISSKYGTYINGKKITGTVHLRDSDFISIADFSAYYKGGMLSFSHKNVRTGNIQKTSDHLACDTAYPLFVRNTRVRSKRAEDSIKVLDPAAIPAKPDQNIVTSLLPAIAMFALVVILRGVLSTTGGTFVLFSICSMGLGVVTSILSIADRKRKYEKDCEERISVYQSYVEKKREEIWNARQEELECLRAQYYNTEQDLEHVADFSSCLFDRIPEDDDFLDVYLGIGQTEALRKIDYKQQETLQVGDDLCEIPAQLAEEYKYIQYAPVVVGLREANAVGVVGEQEQLYEMMKCILIDIVSRQYFGDVSLYVILGEDYERYDWIGLLPHIQGYTNQKNIVCDTESKNNIYETLYKELSTRSEAKQQTGYNIIFVMNERGIKSHPISRFIENASALNTVFLFF